MAFYARWVGAQKVARNLGFCGIKTNWLTGEKGMASLVDGSSDPMDDFADDRLTEATTVDWFFATNLAATLRPATIAPG